MEITTIPILKDNYVFLINDASLPGTVLVDAGASGPVLDAVAEQGKSLFAALITHHHSDHISGLEELKTHYPNLQIYGFKEDLDRIPFITNPLVDNEHFRLGNLDITLLHTPGHTISHVCYYLPDEGVLFSGDTLFVAGCGRLFEGSPKEMLSSLKKLAALPDNTRVYCGHEYTENNLKFALSIEKENAFLEAKLASVLKLRHKNLPTVPSTIGEEKQVNPFLRTGDKHFLGELRHVFPELGLDQADVFATIRELKDHFKS